MEFHSDGPNVKTRFLRSRALQALRALVEAVMVVGMSLGVVRAVADYGDVRDTTDWLSPTGAAIA